MLGYVARSGGDATVDGDEITWGQWYTPNELIALVEDGQVGLPGVGSIARAIIDAWLEGTLAAPES
jgi:NAD+ diphosphatase